MRPLPTVKWSHYNELYRKHLPCIANEIIEIGVAGGGSLRKWKQLYPYANVTGIDIDPACKKLEQETGAVIRTGNQCDYFLYTGLKNLDIVVDDGGHRPYQIARTFCYLWPRLNPNGIYVIEDLQMSQKRRWRIWQRLGFGGPQAIVKRLYWEMNRFIQDDETLIEYRPVVHLYPHIMFISREKTHLESITHLI